MRCKYLNLFLTHTILVLVTVDLGHGVYRKLYTLIGINVQKSLKTTALKQGALKIFKY